MGLPSPESPLVVLGIGNVLLRDDAVGIHVVRALEAGEPLPVPAQIVDGGTGGLSLLPIVRNAGELIIVDAVELGARPGHLRVLTGADLYADPARLSVHEVGTSDLIAAARLTGALPRGAALVGVQPGTIAPGTELTEPVAAAVPLAVAAVRRLCDHLGS